MQEGIELPHWYGIYEYTRAKYNSINLIDTGEDGIAGLGNLGMNRDWIFFADKNGNIKWQKMSRSGSLRSIDVIDLKVSNNNVVVLGNKYYPQVARSDMVIFSFDQKGEYQWGMEYRIKRARVRSCRGNSLSPSNNGKILIGGYVEVSDHDYGYIRQPLVLKIEGAGDPKWQFRYYSPDGDYLELEHVLNIGKSRSLITGKREYWLSEQNNRNDFWIVELSKVGTIKWARSYGLKNRIYNIKVTPEGNIVVVGSKQSREKELPFILFLDKSGKIKWRGVLKFDGSGRAYDVISHGSKLFVVGENESKEYGWIVILDRNGELLKAWKFKDKIFGALYSVRLLGGGILVLAGTIQYKSQKKYALLLSVPIEEVTKAVSGIMEPFKITISRDTILSMNLKLKKAKVELSRMDLKEVDMEDGKAKTADITLPWMPPSTPQNSKKKVSKDKPILDSLLKKHDSTQKTKPHTGSPSKTKNKSEEGYEFERKVADVLKSLGYNAWVTQKSKDFGVDIIVEIKGEKIAIQVKNTKKPAGVKAVQAVYAGKDYDKYKCDEAWIISTSGFTREAKELARSINVKLFTRISEILRMLGM